MQDERWGPIRGFPNYKISDYGRVKNIKTDRILKTSINDKGYEVVCLSRGGKQFIKKIHIMVAEAFVEKYYDDLEVTHIDFDLTHNHYSNLEWRRRRDIRRRHRRRNVRSSRIRVLETGNIYESVTEASAYLNMSRSSISKCLNNPWCSNRKGYHFIREE